MALLTVRIVPDPYLYTVAQPVERVDKSIRQMLDDMMETMYENNGCGLAANQVGILKRLIVMDVSSDPKSPEPLKLVNPEILWTSEQKSALAEGCISIPGQYPEIVRPSEVHIRYTDENGSLQEIKGNGVLSACIQHEIDHLNGILFLDHLSALKRSFILRKLQKQRKYRAS